MSEKWREEREKILDLFIEAEQFRIKKIIPTKASWPSSILDAIDESLARVEAATLERCAMKAESEFQGGSILAYHGYRHAGQLIAAKLRELKGKP